MLLPLVTGKRLPTDVISGPAWWRTALLATTARVAFAAVLLPFFLISAASKLGGTPYAVGPDMPGMLLSLGAFHRLAPWTIDAATGAPLAGPFLSIALQVFVLAELMLPIFLVAGLFARVAAGGLIAVVVATAFVDILAHGAPPDAAGALFDASPFGGILDAAVLWVALLAVPLALGAGPCSLDAAWRRLRRGTHRAERTQVRERV